MTGSLQIKKDKFYMVLNLTQNGKRRQKWISTGYTVKGNKKKAEQMLRETLREYEVKEQFKYSDMFFSDAVKLWLKECAGRVDEITLQGYYNLSNAHILPYFEELGLKRPRSIEAFCKRTWIKSTRMAAKMGRAGFLHAPCGSTRTSCTKR